MSYSNLKSFASAAVVVAFSVLSGSLFAATNEFTGASGGSWDEDANWSLGHAPTADDDVLIPSKITVKSLNSIAVASLTIDGGTFQLGTPVTGTDQRDRPHVSANITGDVTLTGAAKFYVYAGEIQDYSVFASDATALAACAAAANVVTIGGSFSVGDTSVVYPEAAELTGVPVLFKVTGNVTVAEGASFDTRTRGWGWSGGAWADHPENAKRRKAESYSDVGWTVAIGAGLNYGLSGNYGATSAGTKESYGTYGKSYGYTFAPFMPGSPGGNYYAKTADKHSDGRGPGSIVIWAQGVMSVDGKMLADARINNGGDSSGPSGGGIWLAAESFTFGANARLSAEGGDAKSVSVFAPGRGGRIALAEGLTTAELTTMMGGDMPSTALEVAGIGNVTASVVGGQNFAKTARASSGTLSTVRSALVSATLTTQSNVAGLSAEGVTWGDRVLDNGTYQYTAPEYAYLAADDGIRYTCAGWVVSNKTEQIAAGDDRTATVVIDEKDGPFSLTWLWNARSVKIAGTIVGTGSVTLDETTWTSDFEIYVPVNVEQTFVASSEGEWRFVSWGGTAVPGGYATANEITVAASSAVTLSANFAFGHVKRVWVGAANASWDADSNWSPAGVPGSDDEVYLTNATLTVGHTLDIRALTVAGSSKVTFNAVALAGASTAADVYAAPTIIRTTDALVIDGTAVVTAANEPVTGAAVRFDCGSFYLGAKATLTASKKGWFWYEGTDDEYKVCAEGGYQTRAMGPGRSYDKGAGHGSTGGNHDGVIGAQYGYSYAPFLPGSPNGIYNKTVGNAHRPGGTVWVVCGGMMELAGAISADGEDSDYGAPSGGGIWLCAKGIKAATTAAVTAIGGAMRTEQAYGSLSAGGRISLALGLTAAQRDALAAGGDPAGLELTSLQGIPFFSASARGGTRRASPAYGNSGTVTTVVGPEALTAVGFKGSPVQALGTTPPNGSSSFAVGSVQTFIAPECGADPDDPTVRYACTGYVVSNLTEEVTRGSGRSVDVTMANEPMSVTWFWGAAQMRALVRKPAHGTLTVDGEPVDGDAVTWTTGTTASIGAVPDEGYEFVCWEGVLPLGHATQNPLVASLAKPLDVTPVFRLAEEPMTRTWNGTGNWKDVTKWTPAGNFPGTNDTVVIKGGTCTVSNAFAVAALEVTNATLKVGTSVTVNGEVHVAGDVAVRKGGTLTLGYGARFVTSGNNWVVSPAVLWKGHARLAVGGALALDGSGRLEVMGGPVENAYTFATGTSFVEVGDGMTLDGTSVLALYSEFISGGSVKITAKNVSVSETAKIDANGKGYMWLDNNTPPNAPGLGFSYTVGASYGGIGGGNGAGSRYGFELSPVMPGSPNGSYGRGQYAPGGLIRIHAKSISVDGTLDADGREESFWGGPSGGGIWLTADEYAFGANAVLTARGGKRSTNYGTYGGGGRIALGYKMNDEQIAALAEMGTWRGYRTSKKLSLAQFREKFGNDTMTVNVQWGGASASATGDGTFAFVDGTILGMMILVR